MVTMSIRNCDNIYLVTTQLGGTRQRSNILYLYNISLKFRAQVHTAVQQTGFKRVKRGFGPLRLPETIQTLSDPRDPYFPLQWYLKNTGQNGGKPKLDLNVEAAWAQGYTGVNVTTAIMDDGKMFFFFL